MICCRKRLTKIESSNEDKERNTQVMIKAFWNDELVAFVSFKKRSGSLCVLAKFQTDVTIGGELVDDCWPLTSSSTIAPRSVLDPAALLLLLPPNISSAAATETDTLLVTTVGVAVDPAIDFRFASLPFSGPLLILLSSTSDDDDDSTTIDDAELWIDDEDDDTDGPTTTELTRLRLAPRPLLTFTYW